jgi:ABC-2 type transport system permease protein
MHLRALRAMTTASTLELVRDRKTLFYVALYPPSLLAIFLALAALQQAGAERYRFFLASGLFVALASVAFYGIAVPLVALRERGTLRLLSTTPMPRLTVMLAQAPARLALVLGHAAVIAALSAAFGHLPVARLGSLLITCLAGLALLVPIGFLLGTILPSAEAAANALTFALLALLGLAGLFLPLDAMPEAVRGPLGLLPPGLLGAAIRHDLTGVPADHPAWTAWLACLAAGAVLTAAAVRAFRWDDPDT